MIPSVSFSLTESERQAALQILYAQLAQVQAQLEALQAQQGNTAAPAQSASAASCPNLSRNLSRGSRGGDVLQLQQFLISQNLLTSDSATGFFGALTERAVQQFQTRENVVTSGTPASTGYGAVGGKTRVAIARACGGGGKNTSPASEASPVNPSGVRQQILIPAPTSMNKAAQLAQAATAFNSTISPIAFSAPGFLYVNEVGTFNIYAPTSSAYTYHINWGDAIDTGGGYGAATEYTHAYATAGDKTVTLSIKSGTNATSSGSLVVKVGTTPPSSTSWCSIATTLYKEWSEAVAGCLDGGLCYPSGPNGWGYKFRCTAEGMWAIVPPGESDSAGACKGPNGKPHVNGSTSGCTDNKCIEASTAEFVCRNGYWNVRYKNPNISATFCKARGQTHIYGSAVSCTDDRCVPFDQGHFKCSTGGEWKLELKPPLLGRSCTARGLIYSELSVAGCTDTLCHPPTSASQRLAYQCRFGTWYEHTLYPGSCVAKNIEYKNGSSGVTCTDAECLGGGQSFTCTNGKWVPTSAN